MFVPNHKLPPRLDVQSSPFTGKTFAYCYEDWEGLHRGAYTMGCFILQFALPSAAVALTYARYLTIS